MEIPGNPAMPGGYESSVPSRQPKHNLTVFATTKIKPLSKVKDCTQRTSGGSWHNDKPTLATYQFIAIQEWAVKITSDPRGRRHLRLARLTNRRTLRGRRTCGLCVSSLKELYPPPKCTNFEQKLEAQPDSLGTHGL